MTNDEVRICGLAAVQARFATKPATIKRLFFDQPTGRQLGAICKVLAVERKVYRAVPREELNRIAGSLHHAGVVAVCDETAIPPLTSAAVRAWATAAEPVLILDGIGNAHNLGAIARTASFFGIKHLVLWDDPTAARPGDASYRIAEGGLEYVTLWLARDLANLCYDLQELGYDVVGAATRQGKAVTSRRRSSRPLALVVGNEEKGIAPSVAAACGQLVTIAGTGKIESLNVSVASAILLHTLLASGL